MREIALYNAIEREIDAGQLFTDKFTNPYTLATLLDGKIKDVLHTPPPTPHAPTDPATTPAVVPLVVIETPGSAPVGPGGPNRPVPGIGNLANMTAATRAPLTSCKGESAMYLMTQNDYGASSLSTCSVDAEGALYGVYSNEQTLPLFQLVLFDFNNRHRLHRECNDLFSKTLDSDAVRAVQAGSSGLNSINAQMLEPSNVDHAREFVNIITTQRGYQFNSKDRDHRHDAGNGDQSEEPELHFAWGCRQSWQLPNEQALSPGKRQFRQNVFRLKRKLPPYMDGISCRRRHESSLQEEIKIHFKGIMERKK